MLEDFINAFSNFRSKKLRTILSLLGIAIGITVVTIISNIGSSMKISMKKLFNLDEMNVIKLDAQWDYEKQKGAIALTEAYREALEKKVPLVERVFYVNFFSATVSYRSMYLQDQFIGGIEYGALEADGYTWLYGKPFTLADVANRCHKIILAEKEAKELFPEGNACGKRLILTVPSSSGGKRTFLSFSFEVCGVVKPRGQFSRIASFMVPRSFVTEGMSIGKQAADTAVVKVYDPAYIDKATAQIHSFSNAFAKSKNAVWTFSEKDLMNQINAQIGLISVVLTVIAGMSLVVGGINIMNIMMVTVTERKKEIGIRKALGASEAVIRNQFLVESATLSVIGGGCGMACGNGLSVLLVQTVFQRGDFTLVFSPDIAGSLIAFAVSISIGIFFGYRPAVKAARLDPVKALSD